MISKLITFTSLLAAAYAGYAIPAPAPVAYAAPAVAHAAPVAYATHAAVAHAPVAVAHTPVAVAHAPVAVAHAPVAYAAPVAKAIEPDFDPNPQYSYAYDVHDSLTGDAKTQQESRNGDVVTGSYSLIEADGTRRIVEYTADSINGFNAVVHKEPAHIAVKAAVAAAPVAVKPAFAAPLPYAIHGIH